MADRLIVGVLGNRNAGKSLTWNTLFGRTVKTGRDERRLWLSETEWVTVFLVSGSPEERQQYVGDIITAQAPRIVLCSLQYRSDVTETIDYFAERDYQFYIHWLNPGFRDGRQYPDSLELLPDLLQHESLVGIRSGRVDPAERVAELRDLIFGWANSRGLVHSEA